MREMTDEKSVTLVINSNAKIKIEYGTDRIGFFYNVDDSNELAFDLFSEVGQPYQKQFKDYLDARGWSLDVAETDTDYYNIVVGHEIGILAD